ncbi:MAG TPA: Gfo/Idh/MocA family oxidoreductase [Phycisphaerales bacterium]|nr:Gfo/Idh/MocA family oxidoreductase [Phycisphaerales bacterium]
MTPPSSAEIEAAPAEVTGDATSRQVRIPRLGFLGLGWIGRRRLRTLVESGAAPVAALSDCSAASLAEAATIAPEAATALAIEELLEERLDGIVIATPSGLHAEQCLKALERGVAVFCQKPLARNAAETRRIIDAARTADRLLGIDFSYRHVEAFARPLSIVQAGELGDIYAVDLTFHNAYGPDKGWCKDRALAGGGCLIDLGVHLVDYALLVLGNPEVREVWARLVSQGVALSDHEHQVEDYAVGQFTTARGATVRLACSWWASIGQGAIIEAVFHGTRGAVRVSNVNGSFFDFRCERMHGDKREVLVEPPDAWEGRALVAWARQLARNPRYDPSVESAVRVAEVLDRMYEA